MPIEYAGPNIEQIKYWNEVSGQKWIAQQPMLDAQLESLGRLAMDRAGIAAGQRVLDIGCGCGSTTVEIGRRVGAAGAVTGVDLSSAMLDRGREAARAAGLTNVRFENADAQVFSFPANAFDTVYSRFGVMFFVEPIAAFANLHRALRPGGRLAFVCWRSPMENPWVLVPLGAAAKHVPLPPPPAPGTPGPFAFADPERVRGILSGAGFENVEMEEVNEVLTIGGGAGVGESVEFMLQIGPVAQLLRQADPETKARVVADLREAIVPFVTPQGIRVPSAAWIASARNPADS